MQIYVLGFLFTGDRIMRKVALIKKTKPEWQAGRWNGIGGKVEPGELLHSAMVREFHEETGYVVPQWLQVGQLTIADEAVIHVFTQALPPPPAKIPVLGPTDKATPGEIPAWFNLPRVPTLPTISNVQWLVLYCLDALVNEPGPKFMTTQY